ncbi:MAG: ArsC/Spx/MgsR family protein [bacterium]
MQEFIRTNEQEYKDLGLQDKKLTVDEFAQLAAKHPRLLQRPIVIKGDRGGAADFEN